MHPVAVFIRHLLFPAICLSCQDDIPARDRAPLCIGCLASFSPAPRPPLPSLLDRLSAVAVFEGAARDAVHRAKYGRKSYVAAFLGRCAAAAATDMAGEIDAVVAVPLPPLRRISRGFNPAEEMASAIGRLWNRPVCRGALRRRSGHRSQTELGRRERQVNAARSFAAGLGIERVRGRRVLLVDDVCTSGATLTACAALLRRAGATGVFAAVFAWEPPPSGAFDAERRSVSAAS